MAWTSVGEVIDYLYDGIAGLTECVGVKVTDGWAGPTPHNSHVAIGGGPEDDEQSIERDFKTLGSGPQNFAEHYTILIYIRTWTGGELQKPSRDKAIILSDAIEGFVRADMNLGGAIDRRFPAFFSAIDMRQTQILDAGPGRATEIRMHLDVQNRPANH